MFFVFFLYFINGVLLKSLNDQVSPNLFQAMSSSIINRQSLGEARLFPLNQWFAEANPHPHTELIQSRQCKHVTETTLPRPN